MLNKVIPVKYYHWIKFNSTKYKVCCCRWEMCYFLCIHQQFTLNYKCIVKYQSILFCRDKSINMCSSQCHIRLCTNTFLFRALQRETKPPSWQEISGPYFLKCNVHYVDFVARPCVRADQLHAPSCISQQSCGWMDTVDNERGLHFLLNSCCKYWGCLSWLTWLVGRCVLLQPNSLVE